MAKHRLTIRHSDLKAWMAKNYPNQKPSFLFDVVEQQLHAGITVDAYQTLQAENKRLNIRLANAVKTFQQQKQEISELQGERDSLRQMVDNAVQHIDGRSETTYLNIISGLLSLMLGNSPSGRKMSEFANQGAIISAMLAHFEGIPGISVRTLEGKFSEANKSLKKR
ncbi:protein kinase [Klebsiella pneumoniae]|uniref:protein kinase n=1 Tax=Klebsiella pneumoniae TaxID=573 RepID=UPI0027B94993|nr:protein kinase [Klebsiella pneumoniae]WLX58533.1 protein kinase [Klebsiella pneumoniae]